MFLTYFNTSKSFWCYFRMAAIIFDNFIWVNVTKWNNTEDNKINKMVF